MDILPWGQIWGGSPKKRGNALKELVGGVFLGLLPPPLKGMRIKGDLEF